MDEMQLNTTLEDSDFETVNSQALSGTEQSEREDASSFAESGTSTQLTDDLATAANMSPEEMDQLMRGVGPEVLPRLRRPAPPPAPPVGATSVLQAQVLHLKSELQRQQEDFKRVLNDEREKTAKEVERVKTDTNRRLQLAMHGAAELNILKEQMRDLSISESLYNDLKVRPESELTLREWVLLRVYECTASYKEQIEQMKRETDSLRENLVGASTRHESTQRQLRSAQMDAAGLKSDLERNEVDFRARVKFLEEELRQKTKALNDIEAQSQKFDELSRVQRMLTAENQELKEMTHNQSESLRQLTNDKRDVSEELRLLKVQFDVAKRDLDDTTRQLRNTEADLERKSSQALDLEAKVRAVKEKKRTLVAKMESEQQTAVTEVRERVETEISRLRELAKLESDSVRQHMAEVHDKEVSMLREQRDEVEKRLEKATTRLSEEEHAVEELRVANMRMQTNLSSEITELRGMLKLKTYEHERMMLTFEENSTALRQAEIDKEHLQEKVELLRTEYYSMEHRLREESAREHAELQVVREQLSHYEAMEKQVDDQIQSLADKDGLTDDAQPSNLEEALLLGATMGSAPLSAKRRIQESLVLARNLHRKIRELEACKKTLKQVEETLEERTEALAQARKVIEALETNAGTKYLVTALETRENEISEVKKDNLGLRDQVAKLEAEVRQAAGARKEAEDELREVLTRRQHVEALRLALLEGDSAVRAKLAEILQEGADAAATAAGVIHATQATPARAPDPETPAVTGRSQGRQPQQRRPPRASPGAPASAPAWYHRLLSYHPESGSSLHQVEELPAEA